MLNREDTAQAQDKGEELYNQAKKYWDLARNSKEITSRTFYYQQAFELYQQAKNRGYNKVLNNFALCYEEGIGVEKNTEKAIQLFREAVEHGDDVALGNLGGLYQYGRGVLKNEKKAVKLYSEAAARGCKCANEKLAICYESGIGVQKNEEKAFVLYKQASERGSTNALWRLARCYESGRGIAKDEKKAFSLIKQAADLGSIEALNILGVYHEKAIGVNRDCMLAFELYRKAANLGNCMAQYNVALCYLEGKGVIRDITQAIKWFSRSFDGDKDPGTLLNLKEIINSNNGINQLTTYLEDDIITTWLGNLNEKDYPIESKEYKDIITAVLDRNAEKMQIKNKIDSVNKESLFTHKFFDIRSVTSIVHAYAELIPREEIEQMNELDKGVREDKAEDSNSSLFWPVKRQRIK